VLINIYPTPASNYIIIENTTNKAITNTSIIDLNGKVVLNSNLNSNKIDVSNISNGIYIIKIELENRFVYKKIIKN
jgi:hypothetical protein